MTILSLPVFRDFSAYICMCSDVHLTIFPPLDIIDHLIGDYNKSAKKKTCRSSLRFFSEARTDYMNMFLEATHQPM